MKLRAIRRRESMSEWPSLTLFREPTGQIAPHLHQDVITVIHTVDFFRLAPQKAQRESRRSRRTTWNCDTIRLCETIKFIKYTLVIFISMHNSMRSATIGTEQCNERAHLDRLQIDPAVTRQCNPSTRMPHASNPYDWQVNCSSHQRHGKQRNNHLSVDID
jgi:hypothetical protein